MPTSKRASTQPVRGLPTDGVDTRTSFEQQQLEQKISAFYSVYRNSAVAPRRIHLLRHLTVPWCRRSLAWLPHTVSTLDCSRVWLFYWLVHSLELLGVELPDGPPEEGIAGASESVVRIPHAVDFLRRCFTFEAEGCGGYGGGPGQQPHLAPTYAAVMALCVLGTPEAYASIPREPLLRWMLTLKTPEGSFRMHTGGEIDIRAMYTCLASACMLNILTPELVAGVPEYLQRLQTYEGGFGSEPYDEAHGGYTFCALAAAIILHCSDRIDLHGLSRWLAYRQHGLEGGFSGRTNKLVDACYSFWVGACFPLLEALRSQGQERQGLATPRDAVILDYSDLADTADVHLRKRFEDDHPTASQQSEPESDADYVDVPEIAEHGEGDWLFDQRALQEYLLLCCQGEDGGLRDKPGVAVDAYHTCYALSGLSIAQNLQYCTQREEAVQAWLHEWGIEQLPVVVGDPENQLVPNDPVFNVTKDKVRRMLRYFGNRTHI
eukprot:TRINITY_DN7491_c0_g1_i2.p1 TRINITY_DN7491_c0_g1~~TRINITY_DN7491_c0_g1_i2.p1  ORF type:complete len:491 (+),score=66.37 TRINITY_DN7491_c0_g1_i2:1028-2500(+)